MRILLVEDEASLRTGLLKVLREEGLPALTQDLGELVVGKVSAGCVVRAAEPLARRITLGVGGPARWYAEPATVDDVVVLSVTREATA